MTIIAHPKNKKQGAAIEAVLKALDVYFKKKRKVLAIQNLWRK
jgi:hypothetical protein